MTINIGDKDLKDCYLGTSKVKEIYVGASKVYPSIINFATQGPCPDGFHVPLATEMSGFITMVKTGLNKSHFFFYNDLHMPLTGFIGINGSPSQRQDYGYYWTSSASSNNKASYFYLGTSSSLVSAFNRTLGCYIRPFKNVFEPPTSDWTIIYGTLGGAGAFWNQTDGIISITLDGETGYTISDKNLGATTVYTYGGTFDGTTVGNPFKWGNNYAFPYSDRYTTSSTAVDASNYGPGNYYSSNVWITVNPRDSSNNTNLRGGVDGNVPV